MIKSTVLAVLMILLALSISNAQTQQARRPSVSARATTNAESRLTGVYRIDPVSSDKLYSVVSKASSNVPFGEQQRFFIDLTIRLTPPDQLAIERRGNNVSIASSRAPRITFEADGATRTERSSDGREVRTRAVLYREQLMIRVSGAGEDDYSISFDSIDGGQRLRVTRRINADGLNQPVIIQSIYNKISDVARWDIYGEPDTMAGEQTAAATSEQPSNVPARSDSRPRTSANEQATELRAQLEEWIAATNRRDINKQMTFYAPQLAAFYLARNVSRDAVRTEKERAFRGASKIDIQADAPEIIFLSDNRTAVMRFRKRYIVEGRGQNKRGEVVQELRWQQTRAGWRIFSERDVRVIR